MAKFAQTLLIPRNRSAHHVRIVQNHPAIRVMNSWHSRICSITLAARDSSPWREKKSRRRPDQISKSWTINYLNFTFILISSAASKRRGLECTVGVGFCKSGQNFWNTNNFVQKIPLFSHYPVRDVTSVFTIFAIKSVSLCDDALIPVARNRTVMNNVFSDRFPFRRLRSVPSGCHFLAPTNSVRIELLAMAKHFPWNLSNRILGRISIRVEIDGTGLGWMVFLSKHFKCELNLENRLVD